VGDCEEEGEVMACEHHSDYDPASGEPINMMEPGSFGSPCPYCWQARAKYLDEQNIRAFKTNVKQGEHIAELEEQLAVANDSRARLNKWRENCEDRYEELEQETEKREVVLRELLKEGLHAHSPYGNGHKVKMWEEKARAALKEGE